MHNGRNFVHTRNIVNPVLPHLDADMRQADFFCMMVDREILRRPARVRHVVPGRESCRTKLFDKNVRQTSVLVPSTPISTAREMPFNTGVKL